MSSKGQRNDIVIQKEAKWYRNEVIPALEKWRQEDEELKVSLISMISCITRKKNKLEKERKVEGEN